MGNDGRLTTGIDTGPPAGSPTTRGAVVEQVLDALPSGVILTDQDGAIRLLNPTAARLLGLDARKVVGTRLSSIRGEYEPMLWPTNKGEVLLLDSMGAGRVLGFTSQRIVVDGNPRGTVVVCSDITEAKAQSKAADHRRRLADVGTVVATLAHEIRNPVYAISTLAGLLKDEEAIVADPDLALIVQKIAEETRRVSRLVDDTLGFARDRELSLGQTDIRSLFRVIFTDIEQTWNPGVRPVPMSVWVEGGFADEVERWRLDEHAGRQAFSNLVRNAVQAVLDVEDRGGDRDVRVTLTREGANLLIQIIDRGVGIPHEELERVREPFFTSRPTGTGLGMAVADRVVRQHGGRMRLESRVGAGTTVSISLPR